MFTINSIHLLLKQFAHKMPNFEICPDAFNKFKTWDRWVDWDLQGSLCRVRPYLHLQPAPLLHHLVTKGTQKAGQLKSTHTYTCSQLRTLKSIVSWSRLLVCRSTYNFREPSVSHQIAEKPSLSHLNWSERRCQFLLSSSYQPGEPVTIAFQLLILTKKSTNYWNRLIIIVLINHPDLIIILQIMAAVADQPQISALDQQRPRHLQTSPGSPSTPFFSSSPSSLSPSSPSSSSSPSPDCLKLSFLCSLVELSGWDQCYRHLHQHQNVPTPLYTKQHIYTRFIW